MPVNNQKGSINPNESKEVNEMAALALILIAIAYAGGGGGKAGW